MFKLHDRLAEDCFQIGDFPLCRLLMMNDSQYPWFILVPRVPDISEIYQLSAEDQAQLTIESSILSGTLARIFGAHKMNVAALGNVVPQLHIHHIVRYRTDPVWPDPVWGKLAAVAYTDIEKEEVISRLDSVFNSELSHYQSL